MIGEPSVKVAACPACGAQHTGDDPLCVSCGSTIETAALGERATIPSVEAFKEREENAQRVELPVSAADDPTETESAALDAPEVSGERPQDDAASLPRFAASGLQSGGPTSSDMSMARGQWLMDDDDVRGPDPLIGMEVAGRYRLVECIGRGGMGVVYKVEHTEIGKLLALKLLAGELSRQKDVVRRFKREALLASRLTHPNSVQVFDFGVSEGLTYLVMELVNGRDLSRLIRGDGGLTSTRLAKIMLQVCSSLAEAHGIGIVHRDLKPENIVVGLSSDGADFAKVLDFGLAKLRESPELNQVTGTGQVVGTPFYMAPEQIHGLAVDGRSDIYSLGAVMYEALTGETVFRGSTPMAVFTKHLTQEPMPPRLRAPDRMIPPAMEDVVLRCLHKDPDKRFQSVEDLQGALVEHLEGLGQSGVNSLLNPSRLQDLQRDIAGRDGLARTQLQGEIATRDEVTAFKRKLARQRYVSAAVVLTIALGASYAGVRAYQRATAKPVFAGTETEANNQASEANDVPFGKTVRGMLGKRIDAERSDRDFFRVVVPPSVGRIAITTTGLSNMATCTWLYREGDVDPSGRYCVGRPGRALSVASLRVDPGTYLVAIMQDRDPYGAAEKPFVMENVSEWYELTVSTSSPDILEEVEPNDAPSAATPVAFGSEVSGRFDWMGDVDVVCAWPQNEGDRAKIRWVVSDAEQRPRDRGAVLELSPAGGTEPSNTLRLHRSGASGGEPVEADVLSPWRSEPFDGGGGEKQCLRLRLTTDPWTGHDAPLTPPVSPEQWKVRVEKVE